MTKTNFSERIEEIKTRIVNVTNEMLRRAMSHDPLRIEDEKDPKLFNSEGILQDCEFGLNLLLVKDWMLEMQAPLKGELADHEKIEEIVIALAKRMVDRVFNKTNEDQGGNDPDSPAFFSGDPYTKEEYRDGRMTEVRFRSNLDAAMIMTAFTMRVLQQYSQKLVAESCIVKSQLATWVENLRDELLLLCNEALVYADKCKVMENGVFAGFTLDPTINTPEFDPISKHDRLFFTWTACETIFDLKSWIPYLDSITCEREIALQISRKINRFDNYLADASVWCGDAFFDEFRSLKKPGDIGQYISEMKGVLRPSEGQKKRKIEIQDYILHVYHLSQYLSIRSLSPLDIQFTETEIICNKLSSLVLEDIIASGLDSSEDKFIYPMLSRLYADNFDFPCYLDDAYYPLVLRALSTAVVRVMDGFNKTRVGKEKSEVFLDELSDKLDRHYKNLVSRVASSKADTHLWSYARGNPYTFYATQRTIFSLIAYADFLIKLGERQDVSSPIPSTEGGRFHESMAMSLASMSQAMNQIVELTRQKLSPDTGLKLPKSSWASETIRNWVGWFSTEFEEKGLVNILEDRAGKLVSFHKWFHNFDEISLKGKGQLAKRIDSLNKCQADILSELPLLKGRWEQDELDINLVMPLLFDYQFKYFVKSESNDVSAFFGSDMSPLWESISAAEKARTAFDNTASSSIKTDSDEGKNS